MVNQVVSLMIVGMVSLTRPKYHSISGQGAKVIKFIEHGTTKSTPDMLHFLPFRVLELRPRFSFDMDLVRPPMYSCSNRFSFSSLS